MCVLAVEARSKTSAFKCHKNSSRIGACPHRDVSYHMADSRLRLEIEASLQEREEKTKMKGKKD